MCYQSIASLGQTKFSTFCLLLYSPLASTGLHQQSQSRPTCC